LLEKPIACNIADCISIRDKASEKGLTVDVCHVLRYSAYYTQIKDIMDSGVLGKIIAIEQVENVAYWHQAHSFVRGDWGKSADSNPMILAKCCHDLDIAVYLAGSECDAISSVGALNYFKRECAPEGATEYCMGGCKAKAKCPYDAEKLYLKPLLHMPKKYMSMWPQSRLMADGIVTIPKMERAIRETRYGKCVFMSDNDVVDYQNTIIQFANGITSTLTMTAFSGKHSSRETRIRGSLGEIIANTQKSYMTLEVFGQKIKKVRLPLSSIGSHGGGDSRMIAALGSGKIRTNIALSVESHIMGFCAEESRLNGGVPVKIADHRK